ncbi:hypothetical protein RMATCC62417_02117 [Rhizopus microsporus]|nr:hypothetical protein RMATCC62417_02117 [Rhizopus microsporus]
MRELAEDDYEYSIDDALKSSDRPFSDWAQNVKNNNYSPLMLVITRELWRGLVHEDLSERKTKKLNEALLQKDVTETFQAKRQKRVPAICRSITKDTYR